MIKHTIAEQLILHEGVRLECYRCPAGKWTIGVGRNLEAVGLFDYEQERILGCRGLNKVHVIELLQERGITYSEAMFLLNNDIIRIRAELEQDYKWFKFLNEVRQKVVIDMRFNLGRTGFAGFKKMIQQLELKNYWKAGEEMKNSKWYSQVKTRADRLIKMMVTGQDYNL